MFLRIALFFISSISCFAIPKIEYHDFEELMGKNTSHWSYLSQDRDLALLDQMQVLYEKNKADQFSKEEYKIPQVIHFIWLGPKSFPSGSVENLRSWISYHPDWKIKFWTDREQDPPCKGIEMINICEFKFAHLQECFLQSQNWGEKSDLLRYEILLQEGGVYVDHDVYCLASFDSLLRGYDFFCCLEIPHELFAGHNLTCWNGLIGAIPGHPTLARVIDLVLGRWEEVGQQWRGKDLYSQTEVVMQRTYIAFTDALQGTLGLKGRKDIVFPAAYFFAKSSLPSIYAKHFCQTTWDGYKFHQSELEKIKEKTLKKTGRENRFFLYVAAGILCMSSFGLITLFFLLQGKIR